MHPLGIDTKVMRFDEPTEIYPPVSCLNPDGTRQMYANKFRSVCYTININKDGTETSMKLYNNDPLVSEIAHANHDILKDQIANHRRAVEAAGELV